MKDKSPDIIELALKRFDTAETAEADNRTRALEDLRFAHGEQWDKNARKFREDDDRICLTINRIPAFTRQVVNDIRQSKQRIHVRPIDSQGDPETAKIINGMIRAVEQSCNADAAYDWAAEYAVKMGWGFIRVTTEYEDEGGFEQKALVKRIKNPFSVYLDPNVEEPDGSDAEWGFVTDELTREDFEERYPKAEVSEWNPQGTGEGMEGWFDKETVRVAEYWTKETVDVDVSMMPDGQTVEGLTPGAVAHRKVPKTGLS
jgi:hypothetical protein